jgi:hypothetical protein
MTRQPTNDTYSSQSDNRRLQLACLLPQRIERERSMLPMLTGLGVDASEIQMLRGDQQLIGILAEDCLRANEAAWGELQTVLGWHRARLERLASLLSYERSSNA